MSNNYHQALQIRQVYNFQLKAPGILGTGYENAEVCGIVDLATARTIQDVVALHKASYPFLGVGVSRNAQDLIYVKIKTSSGEYRAIATAWMSAAPVLVTSKTIQITISECSLEDQALLRNLLQQAGFVSFEMGVVDDSQ